MDLSNFTTFLSIVFLAFVKTKADEPNIVAAETEEIPPRPDTGPEDEALFTFPEFDYVESSKNEIAFKEWEAACTQTPTCLGHPSLQKIRCIRKCISPSCFNEIYAFDELEEGEIDIRFQSFKGCFVQRLHKRRL